MSYSHGAVTEWYANGPLGLEQGFDVRTPPTSGSGDQLTFVLGLRGNAHARADGHGGLLLSGPGGQRLRYTGLGATDARGHVLGTALTMAGGRAVIHVDTNGAVYPLRIDPFIQVAKFGDADATNFADLGTFALDVKGTTAVASITLQGASPTPGAVDVFVANSGRWELGATKVAQLIEKNNANLTDGFGTSVALSADAKTIAVGAPGGEGKVLVFEQPAGGWAGTIMTPTSTLTGTPVGTAQDSLGKSVSISSDGSLIAAGAPGRASNVMNSNFGAVLIFARPGMQWPATETAPQATLTHGLSIQAEQLGFSVALSGNGSTVVAGAPFFGNADPNSALHFLGEAAVFQQPAGGWTDNSNPALLGVPTGQPNDFFAQAVAISDDAKTIVAGATGHAGGRGAAYVFTLPTTGKWMSGVAPNATLTSSDQTAGLGRSVATDGKVVVAGPFSVAVGGNMGQGAAYIFAQPAGGWSSETETQRLVASDGASGDGLGATVGISNGTVIAAAPSADAPGTPPTQDAGFLYAFGSFPATAISIVPATPSGSNGWYVHPISLAVSASDLDSTVTAIRCVLDPAAPPIEFGALPASCGFLAPAGASVAANGQHAVYAAAMNAAGYAGTSTSQVFKIDTVGPRLACSPPPNFTVHGRGGLVTATVFDATSGAAAPIVAAQANVRSAGNKTVTLTGQDNAGNATVVTCRYTVAAPRVAAGFSFTFTGTSTRFKIITSLAAKKVQRGAKIRVDCKGHGCPFAHRTVKVPTTRLVCKRHHKHCKRKRAPALQNINLSRLLANRRLARGSVVTASAFKPNTTSVTSTFTVRATTVPVTTKCLAPGSKKPFSC